ncbi:hypothetical protein TSUD_358230 [Trifolium subterraneum]|uniref:Uncharacterized protein n=1 Tax=Trifolium subterraneum TaxID=3900 RepID=A0A2Z6MJZ3_TRISU|nr:hypothetical protein TSUD_358230 [Trifolium subterraneum]
MVVRIWKFSAFVLLRQWFGGGIRSGVGVCILGSVHWSKFQVVVLAYGDGGVSLLRWRLQ